MLSKIQFRPRPLSTPAAAPALAPKATSKPRVDTFSAAPTSRAPNSALRGLAKDNLFEPTLAKPALGAAPKLKFDGLEQLNPRRAAVDKALSTGGPVPFTNTDGKTEQVSVDRIATPLLGGAIYSVTVGDDTFSVSIAKDAHVDHQAVLAQIIDAYSETPEDLRGALESVSVRGEKGPDGAAATAGDGHITFYDNAANVTADIFHHEMGHLIGRQVENANDSVLSGLIERLKGEPPPIPDGWAEAAAADGNHLNDYTEGSFEKSGNYTEDFAEAWSEYMRALDGGPIALAAFEALYPGRSEVLKDLYPPA
ncbi:hypothetical protein OV207_19100 [Corallococcus sp. BB11-1]|uniref:hypothetical protein n=1 Tax=Corallococcus sp. BB11-1 TaxID=2996783 RepID=UPI002271EE4D|nr:hypothetical protein [Corallococcus sp. BB11-1]MCY1033567.1 hypothetical protein [Corallococcus sp. BB11-1]